MCAIMIVTQLSKERIFFSNFLPFSLLSFPTLSHVFDSFPWELWVICSNSLCILSLGENNNLSTEQRKRVRVRTGCDRRQRKQLFLHKIHSYLQAENNFIRTTLIVTLSVFFSSGTDRIPMQSTWRQYNTTHNADGWMFETRGGRSRRAEENRGSTTSVVEPWVVVVGGSSTRLIRVLCSVRQPTSRSVAVLENGTKRIKSGRVCNFGG